MGLTAADLVIMALVLIWVTGASLFVCKGMFPLEKEIRERTSNDINNYNKVNASQVIRSKSNHKLNYWLIVASCIGVIYTIYLISHFGNTYNKSEIAGALSIGIVAPHIFFVVVATVFSIIACFNNNHIIALIGAILYLVSGVIFLLYFVLVIPEIVCSFMGWYKLYKQNKVEIDID